MNVNVMTCANMITNVHSVSVSNWSPNSKVKPKSLSLNIQIVRLRSP